MTSHGIVPRTARAAAVSAALVALATACSGGQPTEPTAPTTSSSGSSSAAVTSPGHLDVTAPGIDLRITDAVVHLGASRSGDLTMTVRNGGNAPEHLDMVAAPDGNRGTLRGGHAVDGSMTSAGILLQPGGTVTFGGQGPSIQFHNVHGVTVDHTLPLILQFGIAGLVHLQARVTAP